MHLLLDLIAHRADLGKLRELCGDWCLIGAVPTGEGEGGWSFRTDVQVMAGTRTRVNLTDRALPLKKKRAVGAPEGNVRGSVFGTVLVGRAASNDVIIEHESVSKLHARVEVGEAGVTIRDAGSSNGTRVGDVAVGDEGVVVKDGGDVVFGACAFVVVSAPKLQDLLNKLAKTAK